MKTQLGGQLMLNILVSVSLDTAVTLTKDNCDHLESLDSYIFKADDGFYFNEKVIQKPISISFKDEDGIIYITQLLKRLDDIVYLLSSPINDTLDRLQLEVVTDLDEDENPIGYHFEIVIIPNNLTPGVLSVIRKNSSSILTLLTHSFNELDATLKAIVESAIEDGGTSGVACTQAQWNAIKSLLDKSLYLNHEGWSMIKTLTNGIDEYMFGVQGTSLGATIQIMYDSNDAELYVGFAEL